MGRKAFVILMCAALLLPALLAPFGADLRSRRPDAEVASSGGALDEAAAWLQSRLALRTALITLRGRLLALLSESGSEQVILGKNGFLFYRDTLPDYLGTARMTDEALSALCEKIEALNETLSAQGRTLVVLIAPDKCSVYPELMPNRFLRGAEQSDLARAQAILSSSGVAVVDALSALWAAKSEGQLYFSKDTHWNARGAQAVFRALTNTLEAAGVLSRPENGALAETAFQAGAAGDLLLLCQPGADPDEPDAAPALTRLWRAEKPMRNLNDMRIYTVSEGEGPSLLVVRDSFGERLFPYLANAASRMVYSRVYEDVALQAQDADARVVVLEIAERNLASLVP